ncbi:MAG: GPW/gp25 family protein [Candidatus Zixiibacteriota bacterium]|nr:MAG: GPW/gp25 family protein [candidate division Zixibacteria bacterium]
MSRSSGRHLAFPFRVGPDGRTAAPSNDSEHIRDEIIQLILTAPGERPFLAEFGGGARRLLFENMSDALLGMTKARITQALSRWLGHRLTLEELDVRFNDEKVPDGILVKIQYRPAGSEDSRVLRFERRGQ